MANKLTLLLAAALALASCSQKKGTTDIIAPRPVERSVPQAPQAMQESEYTQTVGWVTGNYSVRIRRQADRTLPVVEDQGGKYYDNRISVTVTRADGSVFFDRSFTKKDFAPQVGDGYMERSALLGLVLEDVEDGCLRFAASVGDPDVLSDDYVAIQIRVSRFGDVDISKGKRLDGDDRPDGADEGV